MKRRPIQTSEVLVVGFGSSYGNDQAGWQVISALAQRDHLSAEFLRLSEVTELMNELGECKLLVVIDACRGGSSLGTIVRFEWPDPRIHQYYDHSTHGIRLCNTFELADRIGRLPPKVTLYGIDIGDELQPEMSPEIRQSVIELEAAVFAEICESINERTVDSKLAVATS